MRLAAYCSTHWNASLAFTNENSEIHLNQEIVFFLRVETRVADLGVHFILLNIYTLANIQMEGGWNLNGISDRGLKVSVLYAYDYVGTKKIGTLYSLHPLFFLL